MSQIHFLTPEQEALIPEYQQKWRDVYLSTEPLDRDRASAAVKQAYRVIGKDEPEIIFCSSPSAALERLQSKVAKTEFPQEYEGIEHFSNEDKLRRFTSWWLKLLLIGFKLNNKQKKARTKEISKIFGKLSKELYRALEQYVADIVSNKMSIQEIVTQSFIGNNLLFSESEQQKILSQEVRFKEKFSWLPGHGSIFIRSLKKRLASQIRFKVIGANHPDLANTMQLGLSSMQELSFLATQNPIRMGGLAISLIWLDFAASVLNYTCNQKNLSILKDLTQQCHWLFVNNEECFVGEHPRKIILDRDNQLHGDGESALELADGTPFYFYHRIPIPEKYGKFPCHLWNSQWVIEEELKPLKELLIREIGADRLCQELALVQVEAKGEYTLFRLDDEVKTEVIHILKRVIPETREVKTATVSWTKKNARKSN